MESRFCPSFFPVFYRNFCIQPILFDPLLISEMAFIHIYIAEIHRSRLDLWDYAYIHASNALEVQDMGRT